MKQLRAAIEEIQMKWRAVEDNIISRRSENVQLTVIDCRGEMLSAMQEYVEGWQYND